MRTTREDLDVPAWRESGRLGKTRNSSGKRTGPGASRDGLCTAPDCEIGICAPLAPQQACGTTRRGARLAHSKPHRARLEWALMPRISGACARRALRRALCANSRRD
jgi:hypothetical protein